MKKILFGIFLVVGVRLMYVGITAAADYMTSLTRIICGLVCLSLAVFVLALIVEDGRIKAARRKQRQQSTFTPAHYEWSGYAKDGWIPIPPDGEQRIITHDWGNTYKSRGETMRNISKAHHDHKESERLLQSWKDGRK